MEWPYARRHSCSPSQHLPVRRNARVVQLKQWLHKRLLWGVRVMQRHNENDVKRDVILWWRYVGDRLAVDDLARIAGYVH